MTHEQKPESKKYALEIIDLALRIHRSFEDGYDRGDARDFERLVDAGLMIEAVYDGEFPADTLQIGETMWVFTPEGLNAIRLFEEGAG